MKLTDLSHPITSKTPVYPSDPLPKVEITATVAKDGFCLSSVSFDSHLGTHIDAPSHMIEGGKNLKDYEIEHFVVQAVCIDGFNKEKIEAANIEQGMAVLFYTGASEYFHEPKYWEEYKTMDESVAKLLINKKVSLVGVDTGSVDIEEDFPVHKALLGADILIIENLTNLKNLVGKQFELYVLPLKLENDGAPVRAVAKLDH